jgi:hypothetical protein
MSEAAKHHGAMRLFVLRRTAQQPPPRGRDCAIPVQSGRNREVSWSFLCNFQIIAVNQRLDR